MNHSMITRSKSKKNIPPNDDIIDHFNDDIDDIDENGNLKDFIDYDMEENDDFYDELQEQLYNISNGSDRYKKKNTVKKKNKKKNDENMNSIFLNYLIMKATEKANKKFKKNKKKKKSKVEVSIIPDNENSSEDLLLDSDTSESEINVELEKSESDTSEIENSISEYSDESTEVIDQHIVDVYEINPDEDNSESSDEDFLFEYDELDEEYDELLEKHVNTNDEEKDMEYFHYLSPETKKNLIKESKEIYKMNDSETPLRFKIINSDMDLKTKAIAIENIDKLSEMDVSTGEHSKMDHWINGLIKIPFGKYKQLPVTPESTIKEKRDYIMKTYMTLDKAIYGHSEAKTHILQVIGKWIKNPDSGGNVLAIQGPMGNGKTTLVKEGISKVLNRPFAFIALGGASDSAFFDGHSYTYEGSHWGRIVQILQDSKCMNPIIYFDELDKISDTQKGDEIIHMLTHLTDPSQNNLFQDNYFPGINLDLSKALFIFSYNDESKINKILKDRMYVINTKGFKTDDKLKICRDYLIPEIIKTFDFNNEEIIFPDETLREIIEKYTLQEEGVRNLKRCIETIVSKINIYMLTQSENNSDPMKDLSFTIKNFQMPFTVKTENLSEVLKLGKSDKPPEHMYM
jgi:ATP-dependent Lon protease